MSIAESGRMADAAWIKELRGFLGLTQEAFGDRLATGQITVSRWETGQCVPAGYFLARLKNLARDSGFVFVEKSQSKLELELEEAIKIKKALARRLHACERQLREILWARDQDRGGTTPLKDIKLPDIVAERIQK